MEKPVDNNLSFKQLDILENKGTEPAFSSDLLKENRKGVYSCIGCGNEVFSSEAKFDSKSGWPSFFDVIKNGSVKLRKDDGSIEVACAKCGGHLGHVFSDGPKPTGKRYCINGEVLRFKE